ncbi:MAG TPA: histidinol phosphate phosphatase domain-containing protein [Chloroflexota bacterium]|nr:histidinol phosphate phosphatase domain-containing protein [Chloroflexota bacterium]
MASPSIHDFHTHSYLSDGVLSPIELIRRAVAAGYATIAVTDHAGPGTVERVLEQLIPECDAANQHWPILALPGVEITHVPAATVADVARRARRAGALVVAVHGETVVEPVEPGTNRAALECDEVDLLAHPGLITPDEARLAAARGCFLEVSGRRGHAFANGHVVQTALEAGAKLLLDSDAHAPDDLLRPAFSQAVLRGAAVPESEFQTILESNPRALIARIQRARLPATV